MKLILFVVVAAACALVANTAGLNHRSAIAAGLAFLLAAGVGSYSKHEGKLTLISLALLVVTAVVLGIGNTRLSPALGAVLADSLPAFLIAFVVGFICWFWKDASGPPVEASGP